MSRLSREKPFAIEECRGGHGGTGASGNGKEKRNYATACRVTLCNLSTAPRRNVISSCQGRGCIRSRSGRMIFLEIKRADLRTFLVFTVASPSAVRVFESRMKGQARYKIMTASFATLLHYF